MALLISVEYHVHIVFLESANISGSRSANAGHNALADFLIEHNLEAIISAGAAHHAHHSGALLDCLLDWSDSLGCGDLALCHFGTLVLLLFASGLDLEDNSGSAFLDDAHNLSVTFGSEICSVDSDQMHVVCDAGFVGSTTGRDFLDDMLADSFDGARVRAQGEAVSLAFLLENANFESKIGSFSVPSRVDRVDLVSDDDQFDGRLAFLQNIDEFLMIKLLDVFAIDRQGSIATEQTALRGDTAFSYRRKYLNRLVNGLLPMR